MSLMGELVAAPPWMRKHCGASTRKTFGALFNLTYYGTTNLRCDRNGPPGLVPASPAGPWGGSGWGSGDILGPGSSSCDTCRDLWAASCRFPERHKNLWINHLVPCAGFRVLHHYCLWQDKQHQCFHKLGLPSCADRWSADSLVPEAAAAPHTWTNRR